MAFAEIVEIDPITADLAVLTRARVVMQQLLLRCVTSPLDPEPLNAAYQMQRMLAEDLAEVEARLRLAFPATVEANPA